MDIQQLLALTDRPFATHPQVDRFFPAQAIEDARTRLARSIERGEGSALVIGTAGTGKSLLLQALAAQFHEQFDLVLLACSQICTRRALLQAILFELGLPYEKRDEGQLRLSLLEVLLSTEQSPRGLLLLVDEAHSLSIPLLEELRVLTNLAHGGQPRVRLVLAGLPSLEESFASPELEAFSQRLTARCYLGAMNLEDMTQYVRAQLAASGAMPNTIFTAESYPALFTATDGVPRLVNQLCDRSLVVAGENGEQPISPKIVQTAWADLQQLPTPWEMESADSSMRRSSGDVVEFGNLDGETFDTLETKESETVAINIPPATEQSDREELAVEEATVFEIEEGTFVANERATEFSVPTIADDDFDLEPDEALDPFAEAFDEEELVLEEFAQWDDAFHAGTPRVENRHEPHVAAMIEDVLAATEQPADEQPVASPTIRLAVVNDPPALRPVPLVTSAGEIMMKQSGPFDLEHFEPESTDADLACLFPMVVHACSSCKGVCRKQSSDDVEEVTSTYDASPTDGDILVIEDDEPEIDHLDFPELFARLRGA